ncbi:RES domain-containing protein [Brachybacterium sp.]|uniref:RES domain-containing protein n=1 Tax=Brachybacterium sp. TaxID=1891286 RepID=UPI003F927BC0
MQLYRVHPWVEGVADAEPYGPLFIPPGQGRGRWDNPDLYALRHFAMTPEGAVAETFGSLTRWSIEMFRVPRNADAVRALSTYELPDETALAQLADPQMLCDFKVEAVTDVIERNTRRTQRLAATIFGLGEWDGISWWSYHHPSIALAITWDSPQVRCVDTRVLDLDTDTVKDAAELIVRSVR